MSNEKTIFSGCVVTFSGVFEAGTHSHLGELVRNNGGLVVATVTRSTTHLVVTKDDLNKPSKKVTTARKQNTFLVTWDWIQQSIEKGAKLAESAFFPDGNASTDVETQDVNISNIAKSESTSHNEAEIKETRANDQDEIEPKPGSKRRRKVVTYTSAITTRSRTSKSDSASPSSVIENSDTGNDSNNANDNNVNNVNEVKVVDDAENKEIVSEETLNQGDAKDIESDNEQAKPAKKRQRKGKNSANSNANNDAEVKPSQSPNSNNQPVPEAEAATVKPTRKRGRKPKNASTEKDNSVAEVKTNKDEIKDDELEAKPAKKRRPNSKNSVVATTSSVDNTATTSTSAANDNADEQNTTTTINKRVTDNTEIIEEKQEEKKMVTIIKKGAAPVDQMFQFKDTTHVFVDEEAIWDCLLNQTDLKNNNNKFFVIQLLQSDSGSNYYVFTKWGRVGYNGSSVTYGPTGFLDNAKSEFKRKFQEKTKNNWLFVCKDISNFTTHKTKYTLLVRDYGGDGTEDKPELSSSAAASTSKDEKEKEIVKPPESKLHTKVQDIIQMIFDVGSWNDAMVALNYDATKLPLGKLSKTTVNQGYLALKRIAAVLSGEEQGDLTELTNEFYTVIPHNFGMRKPPIISNNEVLKAKLQMVETLGEIEIASTLLKQANESPKNQIDAYYDSLMLETLEPLDHNSKEFKLIVEYVKNTQGATHDYYKLEVLEVFDLERKGERERYEPFSTLHNRMLLWHGSRKTNYAGILSQGLRIAPPHVPSTGYMFGKGVYFADCVSKSANYCYTDHRSNIGLMLLCEVALGDMLELVNGDYNADLLVKNEGKHCTKGLGQTIPDPKGSTTLENGTVVPCGKGIGSKKANYLQYNEYIVYDTNQIFQKYLLKIKFNYDR
ncbi:51_t:CDS:2 [Ambispora gerdemannii]|uniref:Poly [ADP-ribose] polymerase n=1 Tax=Ambispora gerdemannii TaxID=144530 RepID=A0A9N9FT99_9GLOM|nr:51_t:CDS:2 [Ambispora gerdemannii]